MLSCQKCKLHSSPNNKEKGIPIGWGSGVGGLFVIGLSPSDSRQKTKYAMKPVSESDTANLITDCLKELNIEEKDFYITNLVKCSFNNNVCDSKFFDVCYNEWLIKELIRHSPKNVICLGEDVYNYIYEKPELDNTFNIKKVWHHAYIARDRSKLEEWISQWKTALKL